MTDILALVSLGEQQLKQQTGSINRLLLSDLSNLFFSDFPSVSQEERQKLARHHLSSWSRVKMPHRTAKTYGETIKPANFFFI